MIDLTCQTCGKPFRVFPARMRAAVSRGSTVKYCSMKCYPKRGESNPKWRGGRVDVDGYTYIYAPTHPYATQLGYVCEHRLVMESHLGRYLDKGEAVHHQNHDTRDNRLENLELCVSNGQHTINHHAKRDGKGRFV